MQRMNLILATLRGFAVTILICWRAAKEEERRRDVLRKIMEKKKEAEL